MSNNPAEYLTLLRNKGVELWVDGSQLRYHARKGVLDSDAVAQLRLMRGELIAALTRIPLSFQQQWLLSLMDAQPHWKATLSYVLGLKGPLHPTALTQSLQDVLHAHAALRARLVRSGENAWVEVASVAEDTVPITQGADQSDAQRLIREISAQEIGPGVTSLMRLHLIRVSDHEHFLILLIHRLASDCLGIAQVLRALWVRYAQIATSGSQPALEESTQYRDFAIGQHATDDIWRQKHSTYWNDYLAGAMPTRLPGEPTAAAGKLASLESPFGDSLSGRLRELGQQTQTLLALVVLTVYVARLAEQAERHDLVIPFQIAGRSAAYEAAVGCFAHVVYLRIRLKGGESFIDLLKLVSNEYYRAAAFRQDSGRMVREKPELLRGTLCQWLAWHPADIAGPVTTAEMSSLGLEVDAIRCRGIEELTNVPPGLVDLEINFFEADSGIAALMIYQAGLATALAATQLMQGLISSAERAIQHPRAPFLPQP